MGDPELAELEISVDFVPKPDVPVVERKDALRRCYRALALRFRPDDLAPLGLGFKASVNGSGQPIPFYVKLPDSYDQLVYGHRGSGVNYKLYLKELDQKRPLEIQDQKVRMEVTLRRSSLHAFQLFNLKSLLGFNYRAKFTGRFRIINSVRVRRRARNCPKRDAKLEQDIAKSWAKTGVNCVAPAFIPPDTSVQALKQITYRRPRQFDPNRLVLTRHVAANAKIGDAFRKLERQMASRFSGTSEGGK